MENNNNIFFYTTSELAKVLKVSMSTVARGIRNSTYPFNCYIRIGRKILYPVSLVVELQERANNIETLKIGVIK